MKLCIFTITFIFLCLCTFWHAIPTSLSIFNDFFLLCICVTVHGSSRFGQLMLYDYSAQVSVNFPGVGMSTTTQQFLQCSYLTLPNPVFCGI